MADKITPKAKQALNALNAFLDEKSDGAETAKAAVDQYNKLKGTLGSSAIASKLGLKEVELPLLNQLFVMLVAVLMWQRMPMTLSFVMPLLQRFDFCHGLKPQIQWCRHSDA